MTRNDFEVIADVMREVAPNTTWINKRQQWRDDCKALARRFKYINPNFKTVLFCEVCGFTDQELYEVN